ncbi:MAG: hypothetical protein MI757_15595 [Pirellulales bacterium]|nr:hypothetical protein [Pirellulales bacterium]
MNLVGKIFIFLVFAMSLVFLTMTMAFFQTQKNWKELIENTDTSGGKVLGLRSQLQNSEDKVKEVEAQNAELVKQIELEKARKVQALASLETERFDREKTIAALTERLKTVEAERRSALTEIDALTVINANYRTEVDGADGKPGLRARNAALLNLRDELLAKVVKRTDEANQVKGEVWRLEQLKKTLEQQLAQSVAVLRSHNLTPQSPPPNAPPPALNGLVAKVSKTGKLVEVTVGFDDGLRKDHTMEVFNDTRYLGRMKVIETKPDSAVGRMETLNGRIQRGDRVATKLKVG